MRKVLSIFGILLFVFVLASCKDKKQPNTPQQPDDPPVEPVVGLSFETNGGETIPTMGDLVIGATVNLPTPTREGYEFAGWYTSEDLAYSSKIKKYVYNGPATIYADWMPIRFELSIISEVPFTPGTYSIDTGADFTKKVDIPTSDIYDFDGWYDGEEKLTSTIMPPRDYQVTAKWVPKKLTVTFDLNGGIAPEGFVSEITNIDAGSTIEMPIPTKAASIFVGWYDHKTNRNNKYTENTPIKGAITLYAHYDDLGDYDPTYPITYNVNGGTLPEGTKDYYDVGVETTLPTPTKAGFEFQGWYTNSIFFGEAVTKLSSVQVGALEFFASWKEIKDQYTVTFVNTSGASTTKTVASGAKVDKMDAGALAGYALGWYKGSELYDFNEPVYEDFTLTQNWEFLSNAIETMLPEVLYDNYTLPRNAYAQEKNVAITWQSSDPTTVSTTGVTNPLREDAIITLTATFTYGGSSIDHKFNVIVPKVEFKDLSSFKPVFAYVMSFQPFTQTFIDTVDVVNVAFGRVMGDSTVSVDEVKKNLEKIIQYRKQGIRVVLSLAGNLPNFSTAALTDENRKIFTQSVLDVIEKYHLDGIDLDWEYPGYNTGRDVEIDRPNFTLMVANINIALKAIDEDYLVTAAVPGGRYGIDRYQVASLNKYLDYFHLMTYDFHDQQKALHHCALYSTVNTSNGSSADWSVKEWHKQGADMSKLVVGGAFYGRIYQLSGPATTSEGIGSTNVTKSGDHITYTSIYNDYLLKRSTNKNIIYRHDAEAQAAWIYLKDKNQVIVFDDPQSMQAKYKYVLDNNLGGFMYWENGEDQTDSLVKAIQTAKNK